MDFMYDLINRRPQNLYPDVSTISKNKNNLKMKLKQGSISSRKQKNNQKMNILNPIDHSQVAKNIYFGQVRPSYQQNIQGQQLYNQVAANQSFYRTLQKNAQTILIQKNIQDQESSIPQQQYSDQKSYQRHKTDQDVFKIFDDRLSVQVTPNTQNIINQEGNQLTSENDRVSTNSALQYTNENNENQLDELGKFTKDDENDNDDDDDDDIYVFQQQQSTAQNNLELTLGSMNVNSMNLNSNGSNQFRISKSKNGLRTPKQYNNNNQKQMNQQNLIYEQKMIPKDQVKSKYQQRHKGKNIPKSLSKPDTYEMLREAQNKLKQLQQSRINNNNNYTDNKYTSDIKQVYHNLQAPLGEISNVTYDQNKTSQITSLKTQQLIKQSTQLLPPQAQNKTNLENKKRGSCFAKLAPSVIQQADSSLKQIHITKNESNIDKLIEIQRQEKILQEQYKYQQQLINQQKQQLQQEQQNQEQQQKQQQQEQTTFISSTHIRQGSSSNFNDDIKSQYSSALQPSSTYNNNTQLAIQNNTKQQSLSIHANSTILDCNRGQLIIDQTKLLSCPRKQVDFSEEDKKIYGDRFIDGYQKISLLGKGGFAIVWLAKSLKNGMKVAIKQICKMNGSDSHMREMRINQQLFEQDGTVKESYSHYPGINNLLKCYEIRQTQKDIFIAYELGGGSVSNFLYEIKGEFYKSERVYKINFTGLHDKIFQTKSNNLLRTLMRHFFNALDLLQSQKIVHCDVKPENILVELDVKGESFEKVSLIDFGSCFSLKDVGSVGMATPEYLPPEMLEVFSQKFNTTSQRSQIEQLAKVTNPWSIDMWSMGAVLLEILTGLPHWLGYKCRIVDKQGKSCLKYGLFSTKGQDYEKIMQKQQQFCDNFNNSVKEITKLFDCSITGKQFQDLLKKMMKYNSMDRISPQQGLEHSFFTKLSSENDL